MAQRTSNVRWVNVAVKPYFSWPNEPVELTFEGKRVALQPLAEEHAATASIYDPNGTTFEHGGYLLGRFLSRLAWAQYEGIRELFYTGSNDPDRPGLLGRGTYGHSPCPQVAPWSSLRLPMPPSSEAELALALFREGMSINSPPFQFLSYFKIINILSQDGNVQMKWVNDNIDQVSFAPAAARLTELKAAGHTDIGLYLYVSGRCAVAHASGKPIVNPDRYEDKHRLEVDLPLMKEVAALFIEKELGVEESEQVSSKAGGTLLRLVRSAEGQCCYV